MHLRTLRQLGGDLRHVTALKARTLELDGRGLPAAVAVGDGRRAVGRASHDLFHSHLSLEGIGKADDDHAEMQERRDEGQDGQFLAAVLGRRRG